MVLNGAENHDADIVVLRFWSNRMRIPLPEPDAPLSALRAAIEERTGVAPQHQKLIVGGAVLQKGGYSICVSRISV
jgi:hypothetical protein